jgi:nucleoporin GLE1
MSTKAQNASPALYPTICIVLAKAIILQAETEVTAEKRSAEPLAQVTFALLERLEHFSSIFWSKLVQRCGGWPLPILVPPVDTDGLPWNSPDDRVKASGVRQSASSDGPESTEEYATRVAAIMRVYFHILKIRPGNQPLAQHFQMSRYWTWFARIMSDTRLLADPAAPQLLYSEFLVICILEKC